MADSDAGWAMQKINGSLAPYSCDDKIPLTANTNNCNLNIPYIIIIPAFHKDDVVVEQVE